MKIPITNKTGKLKVQIKTSFCKNAVAIDIKNTVVLKYLACIKM